MEGDSSCCPLPVQNFVAAFGATPGTYTLYETTVCTNVTTDGKIGALAFTYHAKKK